MPKLTAALALLALAACARPAPPAAGFRDPAAPIYSVAAFDPARLTGDWRQVAAFGAPPQGCAGAVRIAGTGAATGSLCLDGRSVAVAGPLAPAGPGRLAVAGMEDWWVVWVDEGYRTLAVGTPSGAFGFVLDRSGAPAPDRLRAAAVILDFNGYRTGALRPL
jgi:apolipoprotein D and lipocalin family protein